MNDIIDLLNGTYREVGPDPASEQRYMVLRRRYDAEIADVWDAITDPERLRRWFLPVEGDLREGGTFQLKDNAGGAILTCATPTHLALTWAYGDQPASRVDLRLLTEGAETVVELRHSPVPRAVDFDGRAVDPLLNDDATGMWGMGAGWELGLIALTAYLKGEFPADTAAAATDPDLLEAAARISAAWADVAAGT